VFADTLMQLERGYLVQLLLWGGAGIAAGIAVLAVLAIGRSSSRLLTQFALHTLAFGAAEACFAAIRLRNLPMRDLAGATQLDRLLWLGAGLDVGLLAVGIVLVVAARQFARREGPLGAGVALMVQGAALLAMHAGLLAHLQL